MPGHSKNGEAGAEGDEWFRPVWDGDEDAGAAPPWAPPAAAGGHSASVAGHAWRSDPRALAVLLGPALAASDALSRLDARVGTASEPVREGLVRRLALHEAAGWLGAQGAWIHPLDLALRARGLAGPFGLTTVTGRAWAEMPNTAAAGTGVGWKTLADQDGAFGEELFAAAQADDAVDRALSLARALERLTLLSTRDPLRSNPALVEALATLGAGTSSPTSAGAGRARAGPHCRPFLRRPGPLRLVGGRRGCGAGSVRRSGAAVARGRAAGRAASILGSLPRLRQRPRGRAAGDAGERRHAGGG